MAVITKTDLENAALDAGTIREVANEDETFNGTGEATSRLGESIKTLKKVITDLATQDIGASAAAAINQRLNERDEYDDATAMEAATVDGEYGYIDGDLYKNVSGTATLQTGDELTRFASILSAEVISRQAEDARLKHVQLNHAVAANPRERIPGFILAFREFFTKKLLGGFDDDFNFHSQSLEVFGNQNGGKRRRGLNWDFAIWDKVLQKAWLVIERGRLGLADFDLMGHDGLTDRGRGSRFVKGMGVNNTLGIMFRSDGQVEVAEPYRPPQKFGFDQIEVFDIRKYYEATPFLVGRVNDFGYSYPVLINGRGAARRAPVSQHSEPMMISLHGGQSTAGQSGDDPDLSPDASNVFLNCYEPEPREQAYGSENAIGDGLPTIEASEITELGIANDRGWVEHFPVTLMMFCREQIWRSLTGGPSPGQIGFTAWEGGQPIASFLSGTSNDANETVMLTKVQELPELYRRKAETKQDYFWTQGEGGGGTYEADLTTKISEINTKYTDLDLEEPHFIALQVNQTDTSSTDPESRQAVVNLAKAGSLVLAGPMYVAPLADNIHPNMNGDLRTAGMQALASFRARKGLSNDFFIDEDTGISIASDTAVIPYILPDFVDALEWNTTDVPAVSDYGFKFNDDTGALTVSSIEITNGNEVTVQFNRAIDTGFRVRYAINTMDNTAEFWANGMGNLFGRCRVPQFRGGEYVQGKEVPHYVLQAAPSETIQL